MAWRLLEDAYEAASDLGDFGEDLVSGDAEAWGRLGTLATGNAMVGDVIRTGVNVAGGDVRAADIGETLGAAAGQGVGTYVGGPVGAEIGQDIGGYAGRRLGEELDDELDAAGRPTHRAERPRIVSPRIRTVAIIPGADGTGYYVTLLVASSATGLERTRPREVTKRARYLWSPARQEWVDLAPLRGYRIPIPAHAGEPYLA